MATGKVTLQTIKGMVKTDRTGYLWDSDVAGFGLRMTTTGAKFYVYHTAWAGAKRRSDAIRSASMGPLGRPSRRERKQSGLA